MNTSQPVSSQVTAVSFGSLSATDIRSLSARQITSATTFDTLLNPVPGGLYTPELGQFGDASCATCGLKNPQCPGHCGHIEMPVPCYHPTFMDQVLRLLRGMCIYCSRLKMSRVVVHKMLSRLRLIQYGLLTELHELDAMSIRAVAGGKGDTARSDEEEEIDEDDDAEANTVIARLDHFVANAIRTAKQNGTFSTQKTEATTSARRAVIADFMGRMTGSRKCGNCKGINHKYRKDRYVKIFRKPLTEKESFAMIQSGHRAKDPIVELRKKQQAELSRKRKREAEKEKDEGIADMDGSEEGEEEGEGDDVNMDDGVESSEEEVRIAGGDIIGSATEAGTRTRKSQTPSEEYLNPSRVHAHLSQLFEREQEVLAAVYGHKRSERRGGKPLTPDMFFLRTILVPPNRYRPEARTGSDEIAEAQENTLYKNILNACETLSNIQRELSGKQESDPRYRARNYGDLENSWIQLQDAVNSLVDRDLAPLSGAAARRLPDGIKQKLEKKEGMFRKYMMGKRVNFAARTVISPDPNIETNEIGVPPVFAIKLTYPEAVTEWNIEELQEAVKNGPHVWPGAVAIESETGQVVNLERKNAEDRTALANQLLAPSVGPTGVKGTRPKKVHRHLNNGDIVIMNRQPTLHKPSMMCHRARVLPGEKTLRMHYANCNTYNADFDGDEMNMHFPQNEAARAEALSIADTDHQYLSSTAGNPLRGLIQDHISMGVWLTNRDMFFDRADYMQLLYAAIRPESGHCARKQIETVPPAIWKPKPLWTGKQVVTTVLKNISPEGSEGMTMSATCKTDPRLWGEAGAREEGTLLVKDGYVCHGVLDKNQIGPSAGGFVHAVYELYGHVTAGRLLSILGRLLTRLENMRAFSCGVEDLVFTREGEEKRRQALADAETVGFEVAKKYVGLAEQNVGRDNRELRVRLEDVLRDDAKQRGLDQLTNSATSVLSSAVTNACLPAALVKPFPANQMQTMTSSGAKGSKVNANQISCNLGQQILEGRRVPVMVSGKTLPCFKPFESSVRAGGYVVDRFLTGVRPQEFFFHAMAGREGLIDTAVKTSRSGYLQRCLIKGMEGLKIEYDTSVRDADGSIVQFLYGEDGLDVAKAKFLGDFKFEAENHVSFFRSLGDEEGGFERVLSDEAALYNKNAIRKYRKTGDLAAADPALEVYRPSRFAGSTSEKVYSEAKQYMDENPDKLIKDKKAGIEGRVTRKAFQRILDMRYLRSVVEAGEAVGVVAGQSVGEPSTQMTLNTFHLAGHAAKNVTLGIPRLREIVMTAAKQNATPTMTLRLNEEIAVQEAKRFAKGISKLSMAEILDKVTVTEKTEKGVAYSEAKKYEVRLDFFPAAEYTKEYAITIDDVVATIEHRFLPRLQVLTRKELKKRGDEKSLKNAVRSDAMPDVGKSAGMVEQQSSRPEGEREGGDDDSDGEGDDDATRDKAKSNKMQAGYEAFEDDEENVLAARNQREGSPIEEDEMEDEAYGGSPRSADESSEGEGEEDAPRKLAAKERENRIKSDKKSNDVTRFAFDDEAGESCTFTLEYDSDAAKILMLALVEQAARHAAIQSVPGISTAMVDEVAMKDSKEVPAVPILALSGVNIPAMWEYQHVINPHRLYTNSVYDILRHYGVEAARNAIVLELQSVFGGHGISVNARHLTLIADYMTRSGDYQAFNRMGYRGNASPFMKMSFETTVSFLRDAVLEGDWDDLNNPSARIVTGRLSKVGTGGFDIFTKLQAREKLQDGAGGDVDMEED
ncbi:hypothetical protein BAUCODRAFT_34468 [Baudoinia panamericana UAMH 10762]|uniref:DNA-directed RNA polymerase subunit n=1 Tax=Baudoinia panamericana (strain UAMH 10762) TaxID=717646 RepID=M2NA23_BAUPA|nr:uncharacterized protein BAUCODRAFT_34468 [Baudoinia panamericana UAMH 10762]EMC95705.1 hypothetical protein BAUCODRAFT_34468 [Baudoinia panamericana UAMH 10762]